MAKQILSDYGASTHLHIDKYSKNDPANKWPNTLYCRGLKLNAVKNVKHKIFLKDFPKWEQLPQRSTYLQRQQDGNHMNHHRTTQMVQYGTLPTLILSLCFLPTNLAWDLRLWK
jgi:hypothetical protein